METQTVKIWKRTLKNLRMLYAITGESMVSILDRLVSTELNRIKEDWTDYGKDAEGYVPSQ